MNFRLKSLTLFSLILLVVCSHLAAQSLIDLKIGTKYKFVLYDDTEITGYFVSADSVDIKVQTENKIDVIIPKNSILYITRDTKPGKFTSAVYGMGGVTFLTNNYYNNYDVSHKSVSGLNLNLGSMFFLSDTKAIKFDAGYSFVKAKYDNLYVVNPAYQSTETGGDVSLYAIKLSIMVGKFSPSQRFMFYFSLGAGMHYTSQQAYSYTSYEQNYPDTSKYQMYTDYHPAQNSVNFMLSLGAGAGYRFTDHFGILAEAEYVMTTQETFFFFFGNGYFPIRAGLFYAF